MASFLMMSPEMAVLIFQVPLGKEYDFNLAVTDKKEGGCLGDKTDKTAS